MLYKIQKYLEFPALLLYTPVKSLFDFFSVLHLLHYSAVSVLQIHLYVYLFLIRANNCGLPYIYYALHYLFLNYRH